MALATRLAAATERYWAVFARWRSSSAYDAIWTPVLAMLPLPFPPPAMAWGFVLDALFLAGIAAHGAPHARGARGCTPPASSSTWRAACRSRSASRSPAA